MPATLYTQTPDIHEKYWYLRQRLRKDFVKIGAGHGESLPASQYRLRAVDEYDPQSEIIRRIHWGGDCTIDLGWYIAVLATELKLLYDHQQPYEETSRELWFALNAFDRLDDYAERLWEYAGSGNECGNHAVVKAWPEIRFDSLSGEMLPAPYRSGLLQRNGFFIRADVPPGFLQYFPLAASFSGVLTLPCHPLSHSEPLQPDKYFEEKPWTEVYRTIGYSEMSHDQVFHLFMGWMLVTEFVPAEVHYNGESLRLKARMQALRVLNAYEDLRAISNPVRERLVCLGNSSAAFIPALTRISRYFKKGRKSGLKTQPLMWTNHQVNRSLFAVVAAISNSTPHERLCTYVTGDGFSWGLYYLLRKAIYPHRPKSGDCDYTAAEVRRDLELCPCRGPYWDEYRYFDGSYRYEDKFNWIGFPPGPEKHATTWKPVDWFYPNRYIKSNWENEQRGEFNGMDYMLLFNLAKIVYKEEAVAQQYRNLLDADYRSYRARCAGEP